MIQSNPQNAVVQTQHESRQFVAKRAAKHAAKKDDAEPSIRVSRVHTRHKVAKGLAAGMAAVAVYGLAYAVGVSYFSTHFVPGTVVNGHNVSLLTEAEAAKILSTDAESYTNTVSVGGLDLTLTASDIGFTSDGEACAHEAMQSNDSLLWPTHILSGKEISVEAGVLYDESALEEKVSQAVDEYNKDATGPTDAKVEWDDDTTSFVIREGKPGTQLNKDAVVEAVRSSVATQQTATTASDSEVLVQPELTSSDKKLKEGVEQVNQIIGLDIPVTIGEDEQMRLSRVQIAQWVDLDDDHNVVMDEEAIESWAQENLADGASRSDDDYDYALDAGATASALMRSLENGSSDAVEVEVTATKREKLAEQEQAVAGSWNSSQGRYIDVDLANQYARLYDANGAVIWESYVVSGDTGGGHGTPVGTFSVYAKETNQDLVGLDYDNDGLPDYRSHVNYWMPFSGGYGLHDAMWRDSFGGSIYSYSGSHGCVNLPYDAAASLFSMISVGETVVVHW